MLLSNVGVIASTNIFMLLHQLLESAHISTFQVLNPRQLINEIRIRWHIMEHKLTNEALPDKTYRQSNLHQRTSAHSSTAVCVLMQIILDSLV